MPSPTDAVDTYADRLSAYKGCSCDEAVYDGPDDRNLPGDDSDLDELRAAHLSMNGRMAAVLENRNRRGLNYVRFRIIVT